MEPQESPFATEDGQSKGVVARISIPEQNVQKCLMLNLLDTVGAAKDQVLARLAKDVTDAINYGLYVLPSNGRSGKFLEEERLLSDYSLHSPITLEFKFKSRDYRGKKPDEKLVVKTNAKASQKKFMDQVTSAHVDKMMKLFERGFDPNFQDDDSGKTPLIAATSLGGVACKDTIMCLVNGGAHMDFRARDGQTAMHHAIRHGNQLALKVMLDLGASPNYRDCKGLTPAYYSAVLGGDASCLELLLSERAAIEVQDGCGWREIHQVCKHGRVKHLEHLIFYGADLHAQNATGNTALHICSLNAQEECARVLLFRGAKKDVLNFAGQTAYEVAVIARCDKMAQLIDSHSDSDAVPFRQKPTYAARRRPTVVTPILNPVAHREINVSNLKAVSVMSASDESPGGHSSARKLYESSTAASSTDASPSLTGGRTADQPQALSIITNGSPSNLRDRSMSSPLFSAIVPPNCKAPVNPTLPAADNVTVQLCDDPYSSLARNRRGSLPRSPSQAHKAAVNVVNSVGSPRSSPKVKPKHKKSTPPAASPTQLPSVFTRLYPAVAGRKFIAAINHSPRSREELELWEGDEVEVLFIGKGGMWEGRVGSRRGWFPSCGVKEMTSIGHVVVPTGTHANSHASSDSDSSLLDMGIVVMSKGEKGLGFSIRGPKTVSPNLNFRPTNTTPSLQRIGDVDKGGVAEMAGLRGGDHLLEVNGQSVVKASHSEVVKLIKSSSSELKLTIARRKESASPQASQLSSPDIKAQHVRSVLHRQLSDTAMRISSQKDLSIHATPPRPRAMTTSACRNSAPTPPQRKSSRLTGMAGDLLTSSKKTNSLPNQRGDISPELAGVLAKRASQVKSTVNPSHTVEANATKKSDSEGSAAMIARLAAERNARVAANGKAVETDREKQSGTGKESSGEMSEFEKALAARKAKLNDQNAEDKPNTHVGSVRGDAGPQGTEIGASNVDRPLIDGVDVPRMVRDDSGMRLRALSDAASKRQIRQPQVRREGAAEQASMVASEQPAFDLSAILHAVPPVDCPQRDSADNMHGVSSRFVQKVLPTNETVPVVVGNETVDMDLDKVLALWGQDTALQETPLYEPTETVCLESDQNDLVNGVSSWDDIQLPPPDFPLPEITEKESYKHEKHLLRKISEEPSYLTLTPPVEFASGDVVEETFSVDDLPPPDDFESHIPPPELIPGLSSLEAELESMYPFAVPTPLLGNEEERDELPPPPPPPPEFDGDDGFVAVPPEGFDVPQSKKDNTTDIPSGFEDFLPPPVVDETFPVDLSVLPPPHLVKSAHRGQELSLTTTATNSSPSSFNDNQGEVGRTLQTEVHLGGYEPPPLPSCPPPSAVGMENPMLDEPPPPLPDTAPPYLGHNINTMPIPEESELVLQKRLPVGLPVSSGDQDNKQPEEEKRRDSLFALNAVVELNGTPACHSTNRNGVSETQLQDSYKSKVLAQWTVGDVSHWLRSVSMDEYVQAFQDNQIRGLHLAEMTKDDFKELGVLPLGHRLTLANAVARLQ